MSPITRSERVVTTVNAWKNKLLDLTKRNRALNFKVNKVSTVTIIDELPSEIFRLLCLEKKLLRFGPSDTPENIVDDIEVEEGTLFGEDDGDLESQVQSNLFVSYDLGTLRSNHTDEVLQTNASSETLDKSLRRIDDQARLIVEEQGINALYLAIGMLHYIESKDSSVIFKAPLILVPVELERVSAKEGFRVKATDEEVIVNPSLVEYLQQSYGISLPELPDSSSISDSYNLQDFLGQSKECISNQTNWKITDEIYLGLFSFQKLVMYKDLEKNIDLVEEHRIFQQIINKEGDTFIELPVGIRELPLDKHFAPEDCVQVVDADSSQLRAIATVSQNYDLVLEGPPGTGKSQTITNLIAQALSAGKTVLFVAEKMAALDVVHRRLCEVGLGEFCLELHSTKANKRTVMQELRNSLEASLHRVPENVSGTQRLAEVRAQLTNYVAAVHEPFGNLNVSPFKIYGEFNKVLNSPRILLNADITHVSAADFADVLREINDLALAAEFVGSPQKHAWRETTKTYYSQFALDEIEQKGIEIISKIDDLLIEAEKLESVLGLPHLKNLADIETASAVATTIARSPGAPFAVLVSEAWNNPPPEASELIKTGRETFNLRKRIEQNFSQDVFDRDPTEEIDFVQTKLSGTFSFLAIFSSRYRSIRKKWLGLRHSSYNATIADQAEEMRFVSDYLRHSEILVSKNQLGTDLFGDIWKGESSDWGALDHYVEWVLEFRQLYINQGLKEQAIATATTSSPNLGFVQILRRKTADLKDELMKFSNLVGWLDDYLFGWDVAKISSRIAEITSNLSLAQRWAAFELVKQKIESGFAKEIIGWIWDESVPISELSSSFRRAFYQRWLSTAVEQRPELRYFSSISHEQRIKEFRELDEQVLRQNQTNLIGKMRDRLQENLQVELIKQQMLTLRRELNKQRRIMPLRVLMKNCLDIIRTIKPCFMMSPQTVAQLLDAQKAHFDLILFDEASQLPTEDAVGAIMRGTQLVVVGDPKQLPPTNFFAVTSGQVNYEKDEDGQPIFQDSESILEEVQSSGVPSSRLKWHYRSAHESLITFSNVNFYDSDLYTFPSNDTEAYDSGLQFQFVENGIYEGKGLNKVEARKVADAVVEHARRNPEVSLGVGTFNLRQQIAIQDELELRRRADSSLESFFDRNRSEPFFVKNLENIQGDERDVIFLSVTYAKANDGRLRYNFGPLNSENGGRRMNVLTTRARKLMRVFSSIRSSDIHIEDTVSKGARLLRDYLLYAEHRRLDSPTLESVSDTESPFEREVLLELTQRGISLKPQIGVSGYKIDFGVYDSEITKKFICGIECDGVAYHSSETARDRDRLRQQVLERRGWEIHRIWSTDWFKDREGQIERIIGLIEQSRINSRQEALEEVERNLSFENQEIDSTNRLHHLEPMISDWQENQPISKGHYVRPQIEQYELTQLKTPSMFGLFLYARKYEVTRAIIDILEQEAPIHKKDLFLRVASTWGQKAGKNISLRIERELLSIPIVEIRGDFVFIQEREIKARCRSGTGIPADRIASEEIRDGILVILATGHKFGKKDLINEVRSIFGFDRTGTSLQQVIERQIEALVTEGVIGEGSTGIGLRKLVQS
ncbi:MAG: DUF4011 domain-containing protein [Pyrinomonadaceae bacterium]|nr:DUF4011 domain-containing protein [Pyrinomonadaceae bacterium]MBP6213581.1 DUF4011 domain-containing protein [Pyrinomonadaceae bacterium]